MRKAVCILIALTFLIGVGAQSSYANVSSAAVLFLRIAAGARAAGMGEAFVAVADDATATHWNPAGLGTYPLSYKWVTVTVPEEYRPLSKIALYGGSSTELDYKKYDIWALSPEGLLKYSNNKWQKGEVLETGPKETAELKLRQYAGLTGDVAERKLPELMEKLGRANNKYPRSRIEDFEKEYLGVLTADADVRSDVESTFVELRAAYNECLVDWDNFGRAEEQFRGAYKDSVLTESESDRVWFALQKGKRKYMPENIVIPFELSFIGRPRDLAAAGKALWVATDSALYRYSGTWWQRFGVEEGLPPVKIYSIKAYEKSVYLSTDKGLVVYRAGAFDIYDESSGLPQKPVSAVTAVNKDDIWAVVDGDLYHYDGALWKNYIEYSDVLNETPESIYERLKIYGTPGEKRNFIDKFNALNDSSAAPPSGRLSAAEMKELIDSIGVLEAFEQTQKPGDVTAQTADSAAGDAQAIGRQLRVPYTAGIPFAVRDMEMDNGGFLWIGTEYGLLRFNGREWHRYGYRDYTIESDISILDLALGMVRGDTVRAERLVQNIKAVNDLNDDALRQGQIIKLYANPAGAKINDITPVNSRVYFATESGTVYVDRRWARFHEEGLSRRNTRTIAESDGNLWFGTIRQIKIKAAAKSEVMMMHVNWLPELADDIYYEFFSYVRSIEEWGTVGGNITFLSYGRINRRGSSGEDLGDFSAFDIALTISYGTSLAPNISGGLSAKIIYSHLSSIGAG
ncbi:MAG: hypothetical protein JSV44_12805, partial [Candidatus Zixiibacteriota bacterium]